MTILESVKAGLKNHFDKKKEKREFEERLRLEAEIERRRIFEEEFKRDAKLVAIAQAKREAAEKSGLQKLRAVNRARNLNTLSETPGSFFEKLSNYTKKNIAKREENLKRTAEMRATAKQMREERLSKRQQLRRERLAQSRIRKPFSKG